MKNFIQEVYKGLFERLARGESAAVVSECNGEGIRKRVVGESDAEWAELSEFLAPISYKQDEQTGSLTLVERYAPKPRIVIFGGGHIALALTQMAKLCDFRILVFDDRPAFASSERFPQADEVVMDDFSRLFERVHINPSDYVCILTRGHKHDAQCLEGVLKGVQPAYLGMIGSRRRVAIVMKNLEGAGYSKELLETVHSPIGLKIAAVTPAEIAISILSEIISIRRGGGGGEKTCDIETAEALANGAEADALLTIIETRGSVPREAGAKMAMTYEGKTLGTIGGGCAEAGIMQNARGLIRDGGWKLEKVDMTDTAEEDGMVCGGEALVLIESTKNS